MKAGELLSRFKDFLSLLEAHRTLWEASLSRSSMGAEVVRNRDELEKHHRQLHRLLGVLNPYIDRFALVRYGGGYGQTWDIFLTAASDDLPLRKGRSLQDALPILDGIIAQLELKDPDEDIGDKSRASGITRRIFISHGTDTLALGKLERYVRALGLDPIIVKHQPSLGGSVDDVVEGNMNSCVAAVILATCDEQVSGCYRPRPNVIHETGMAQQKLKNHIVYLKERGCDFPSNMQPKIWQDFTQDNMEEAFIKIAKELAAFDLL